MNDDINEINYGEMLFPPFEGSSDILIFETEKLLNELDLDKLFKGYWRGGSLKPEDFEETKRKEFEPAFEKLKTIILEEKLIDARGFYCFFPVIREGETLILLDPANHISELASFQFPVDEKKEIKSFAGYFRPEGDILGVQIVTIGNMLSNKSSCFFKEDDRYSDGFYLNAIGSLITDELAEKVTSEIRRGLAIDESRGKRFSFGYPGMCDVSEQKKLFEIMSIEERLGIALTEGFQMIPEHSTLGLFTSFERAEYF